MELLISLTILFLVSLYTMSMFSTGQSHFVRAQQYSMSSFLVNAKLQEVIATPFADLSASSGKFPAPYDDFSFTVSLEPYELDMTLVRVEVISRRGAVARARTLLTDDAGFAGLAIDPATERQASGSGSQIAFQSDGAALPSSPATTDGRRVGAIAGHPGWNLLWIASARLGPLAYIEDDGWQAPVGLPTGAALPPLFTGLAISEFGSDIFVGDSNNRGLWILEDSTTPTWSPLGLLRATDPPLGSVSGVTTDPFGSLVWVADRENQCLRKLLISDEPNAGYPASQVEQVGPRHYWHKTRFRPPGPVGLGSPHGIAMDPSGYAVYVLDRGRIYRFVDQPPGAGTWSVLTTLPTALVNLRPSGLALDPFGNILYISTVSGPVWRFPLGASAAVAL